MARPYSGSAWGRAGASTASGPSGGPAFGDILAGEEAGPGSCSDALPAVSISGDAACRVAVGQRSYAAQKRMERLQLGGVATANAGLVARPPSAGTPGRGAPRAAWASSPAGGGAGALGSPMFGGGGGLASPWGGSGGGAGVVLSAVGSNSFGSNQPGAICSPAAAPLGAAKPAAPWRQQQQQQPQQPTGAPPPAMAPHFELGGQQSAPQQWGAPTASGAGEAGGGFERVAPMGLGLQSRAAGHRETSDAERMLAARGLCAVYDPTEGPPAHSNAGAVGGGAGGASGSPCGRPPSGGRAQHGAAADAWLPAKVRLAPDVGAWLMDPAPRGGGVVQCIITREKDSVLGMKDHKYQMFLDDGRQFIAAARRRKGKAASHYDITTSQAAGAGARFVPGFAGKLRANFVGTEFTLFDAGAKPGRDGAAASGGALRRELAAATYAPNILGTKGPRKIAVALAVEGSGGQSAGSLLEALRATNAAAAGAAGGGGGAAGPIASAALPPGAVLLRNKAPRWNEAMHAFCLNFHGRVHVASVKNFQLVVGDSPDTVVLQFGKAGSETFTCDFRWPLTPLTAFAMCLSSFDSKLACE